MTKERAKSLLDRAVQKNIPISSIIVGDRHRKTFNGIEELATSIAEKGLLNPICVSPLDNDTYLLVAGERRLRAIQHLERTEIKCRLLDVELDELTLREIELLENVIRKDMLPAEKITLMKQIHELEIQKNGPKISTAPDAPGHSAADTAEMLGVSQATVSRNLQIARIMDKFPEAGWEKCKTQSDLHKLSNRLEKMVETAAKAATVEEQFQDHTTEDIISHLASLYRMGDCLDGLRDIPNGSIKLFEFDPPYAIDLNKNKVTASQTGYNEIKGSEYENFMRSVFNHAYRCLQDGGVLLCWYAIHPWHSTILQWLTEAGFTIEEPPFVWVKPSGGNARPAERLTSTYEPCFIARKGKVILNKMGALNSSTEPPVVPNNKIHPTQRPIELIRKLLSVFAKPGDKVCVPCLGSGTTILAAHLENLEAVGWDLNENYRNAFILMIKKYLEEN